MIFRAPAASDSTERIADWLELRALYSREKTASLESLVRVIRRGGTVDGLDTVEEDDRPTDQGSTISQRIGEDAFSEMESRSEACDGEYPYDIEQGLLRLRRGSEKSPYLLLLLLSFVEPTAGHNGTAALFEKICAHAARHYFGGEGGGARSFRFGSPRKSPVTKLSHAIDYLCAELLEGGGCRAPDKANHTGDEGLDVVAWKHFPDRKAGKLIAFGQCAGGARNWTEKLNELDGRKFAGKWFRDQIVVDPIRFFFVPRRIRPDDWNIVAIDAGVIFDRCRIAACFRDVNRELRIACNLATQALRKKVQSQ